MIGKALTGELTCPCDRSCCCLVGTLKFNNAPNHWASFTFLISSFLSATHRRIYDTSSNDTSSIEPFRRKSFLSNCHFIKFPFRRNSFSSNTFDEIFYARPVPILYLLNIGFVRLRTLAEITNLKLPVVSIRMLVD